MAVHRVPAPALPAAEPLSKNTHASGRGSFDPRPDAVVTELRRIERRWAELPVERALAAEPALHELIAALAAATHQGFAVPDLGPAAALDQLKVLVFDACAQGLDPAPRLTDLRRALG